MNKIEESVEMLLQVIRGSEVYMDYKKQEEKIMANPELLERVNQFRVKNYRLQKEAESQGLFRVADSIAKESSQLRKIPEVNAYLDAELALCKLLQKIGRTLTEGIDMMIPEL
ncbi:MAG: YlbF family regulator [Eubacteriales bacterium]|nr:YlbF family regulator [Eubacteriales bacterium]